VQSLGASIFKSVLNLEGINSSDANPAIPADGFQKLLNANGGILDQLSGKITTATAAAFSLSPDRLLQLVTPDGWRLNQSIPGVPMLSDIAGTISNIGTPQRV
jgi:hypothetical protein